MNALAAEYARQARRLSFLAGRTSIGAEIAAEIPIRIHERSIDDGGAPEWHPAFVRYLESSGVCLCRVDEPEWIEIHGEGFHVCDRRHRPDRFRNPNHRMHPHRLRRALRQLRSISKDAFEVVYPVLARGMTWEQCRTRIAADRYGRGEEPHTDLEWAALVISGLDLTASSY